MFGLGRKKPPGGGSSARATLNRYAHNVGAAKMVTMAGQQSFFDIAVPDRVLTAWRSMGAASQDANVEAARPPAREISRYLHGSSALCRAFVASTVRLTVGGRGLRPMGMTEAADKAVLAFGKWCMEADIRGMDTFYSLQSKVLTDCLVDGDQPIVKVKGGKLQVVPSVRLVNPIGQGGNSGFRVSSPLQNLNFVGGVEMNAQRRPVRYHFATYDGSGRAVQMKTTSVDAENVMFLALRNSADQTRGMPLMTAAMKSVAAFDDTTRDIQTQQKMAARFGVAIHSAAPEQIREQLLDDPDELGGTEYERERLFNMDSGTILNLAQDDKLTSFQPGQPNAAGDTFFRMLMIIHGASIGIPASVALGDFSGLNFSQAKIALQIAGTTVDELREMMIRLFCEPVYRWWLASIAPEFNVEGASDVGWIGPPLPIADPSVEVVSDLRAIAGNLTTQQIVLAGRGLDYDAVVRRRALERKKEKELGIEPMIIPGGSYGGYPVVDPNDTNQDGSADPDKPSTKDASDKATDKKPARTNPKPDS